MTPPSCPSSGTWTNAGDYRYSHVPRHSTKFLGDPSIPLSELSKYIYDETLCSC